MSLPKLADAAPPEAQLNPQQIAMLRSLRNGALLPQLLSTYRHQLSRELGLLKLAVVNTDHATLRTLAHTLKSASFSVGANRIGELCAQLEAEAIKQSAGNVAILAEIEACVTQLMPEIDRQLAS